jgi:acyl-CoA thioesterase-1
MNNIYYIKKILIVTFTLCFANQYLYSAEEKKFLILGDSISAGYGVDGDSQWTKILQKKIQGFNWKIVNASISGDTTGGGLSRVGVLIKKHKPSILLIELGGNDALRGYPTEKIKSNLKEISSIAINEGTTVLLMQIKIPPNYGRRYVNAFESIYTDLSKESGITYLPFMLDKIALNDDLMLPDGIHPNTEAQPLIADILYEDLKGYFNNQ